MSTRPLTIACAMGLALVLGAPDRNARAGDICTYEGERYSEGSVSCQAGTRYKCDDGEWESKDERCTTAKADRPHTEERVIRKRTETETHESD